MLLIQANRFEEKKGMLSLINKSDLIRNIAILISGTTIAQLIPILLQPLLRRFFLPEVFGAYAVYLSLIGILIMVASLKFELAIILPEDDETASNLLALTVLLNFCFCSLILLVIIAFRASVLNLFNIPEPYSIYLYFIPLGVFLYSMYQSINFWLIRKKRFFLLSLNKFLRRGTEGSGQVALMFAGSSAGLVIGDVLGQIVNCVSGTVQAFRNGFELRYLSIAKFGYIIRKYIEYPKFNLLPSFMSACSYLMPALMINRFFSTEFTGYFDLSKLMLSIPLALVATSISNVLLQMVSEQYRNKLSFARNLYPIIILVVLICLIEIIVIRLWGKELFIFFFGNEWELSGIISKVLVWAFAFNFLTASFSSLFISMKKIKLLSVWQLFYFLAILSLIFFRRFSFEKFVQTYVVIEIICSTLITFLMIYVIWSYENRLKTQKYNPENPDVNE
jgi:O-antigen/teichoic acid export membrane protein